MMLRLERLGGRGLGADPPKDSQERDTHSVSTAQIATDDPRGLEGGLMGLEYTGGPSHKYWTQA